MVMHGNAEKVVPIVQGEIIFRKRQSSGVESEYIEFEEASYSPTIEQAQRGVSEALKWFEKHLGS
jgi:dipeptidyl aminopeptidase/acylaminoacyl peptidase